MALTCVAGVNWEGVGERDSLETGGWEEGTPSLLISPHTFLLPLTPLRSNGSKTIPLRVNY